MSVSIAFSNALSGLSATSRRAEVVSDNVANALTEGFAGREVRLATRAKSGGVEVIDVARRGDPEARARLRLADSGSAGDRALAEAGLRIAEALGGAGDAASLASRAAAFEASLGRLADTPESAALQTDAADAASALAGAFVSASREIQATRAEADAAIGRSVAEANEALSRIETLNREIVAETALGGSGSRALPALEDAREGWVDALAGLIPVRTVRREAGDLMVYAPGGAVLLEGRARTLEFDPAPAMTADSTLASGALDGLALDGVPIDTGEGGPLAGGALSASFAVRDRVGVEAQTALDAVAADLVQRFESPVVDPSLAPGDAGLFTDAGAPLDLAAMTGLAGRLRLNAAVDRFAGGDPARLRDGLGASPPRPAGDPTLPLALLAAFTESRPAPAATGLSKDSDAPALIAGLSGLLAQQGEAAEAKAAAADGRRTTLAEAEAASRGVDVDAELADLLVIEQAYAANARVVSAADELLRTLLEM